MGWGNGWASMPAVGFAPMQTSGEACASTQSGLAPKVPTQVDRMRVGAFVYISCILIYLPTRPYHDCLYRQSILWVSQVGNAEIADPRPPGLWRLKYHDSKDDFELTIFTTPVGDEYG